MDNLTLPSEIMEPMILAHCVNDLSYFMKIRKFLDTRGSKKSYFNDEKYQYIFNLYSGYFEKYDKQPKKITMLSMIEKLQTRGNIEEELVLYYNSIIEKMYSTDFEEYNEDYVETQTVDFIKQARAFEAIIESQTDINEGRYETIVSRMEEAVRVNLDKDLGLSIKDYESVYIKINEEDTEGIVPTGYQNLDNFLGGGLFPSTLNVLSATPGVGKCCRSNVKIRVKYKIDTETGEII